MEVRMKQWIVDVWSLEGRAGAEQKSSGVELGFVALAAAVFGDEGSVADAGAAEVVAFVAGAEVAGVAAIVGAAAEHGLDL